MIGLKVSKNDTTTASKVEKLEAIINAIVAQRGGE
jgi:hypothetical protein